MENHKMFTLVLFVILVTMDTAYGRKVVDLSHTLDETAPKWPLGPYGINLTYFQRTSLGAGYFGQIWMAAGAIEFYEHMGTHMDAPSHHGSGRQDLHEIPVDKLLGPGVVINVREQAKENPVYEVTTDDIHRKTVVYFCLLSCLYVTHTEAWETFTYERKYGRIQPGSIVMMNSGWSQKYPSPELMFNTQDIDNATTFRFPGFGINACVMLLQERQVSVVGVDTSSVDISTSFEFECHQYLQHNNIPLLEYVANLDSIPPNGTTIMLGAMKVRGATGAPVRVLAFIDDDEDKVTRDSGSINTSGVLLTVFLCLLADVNTNRYLISL